MAALYAGLDVSLELTSVFVVDEEGRMVLEAKVASEPDAIIRELREASGDYVRVGLEAGPLSQWLWFGLKDAGLPAVCIEARHAKAAMVAMNRNKNDRNDARSLAQLIRSGWFKAVHVKSRPSQELRTLLTAREFYVNKLRDHENEIRGVLRLFGLKVGKVGARDFEARTRELVAGDPLPELCIHTLLAGRAAMKMALADLHRALLRLTENDELCRRFMTIPGVGPVTALAFKATIDDPARFRRSNDVGAHLGLTPRQYQSGETDIRGRISRSGDAFTRTALFTAAHVMLTRSRQWTAIRAWGVRIAQRSSLKKAKITVARKLAVIMHRMWRDATPFRWGAEA
ncbi:MAG: IS110 family transposase [Ahrensia sp.]